MSIIKDVILCSFIVPVYNIEKYISTCIESILCQTYTAYELILVDDGSSDTSGLICDEYSRKDSRIRVIHKQNDGVVNARKSGVDLASGTYIVCVDGDDWIAPCFLSNIVEAIEKHAPDMVCCGFVWSTETKAIDKPFPLSYGVYDKKRIENEIFPILIENNKGIYLPSSLWAKAIRTEIYRNNQLSEVHVDICEDHACVASCIFHSKVIAIISPCLYYYRINPASVTKSKRVFLWNTPKTIVKHFEEKIGLEQFDLQEQVYRFITHNLFVIAASQFSRNETNKMICSSIKQNLNDVYYANVINNCHYKSIKGFVVKLILKFKLYSILKIYNRIR